jgi:8-oxo-dGTP diphosphatase
MSDSLRPPTSKPAGDDQHVRRVSGTERVVDAVGPAIRIGAKALVTAGNRVLLVKERREDGSSFWTLPGGGVETGETLTRCVRREIAEEIQCDSTVGRALTTCSYRHTTAPVVTVYTVFAADVEANPTPNLSEGIVDYAWTPPGDLPTTTLDPFRSVVEQSLDGK